jgi:hypothetical protein
VIVPAIALVHMRAFDLNPGYGSDIRHRGHRRVTVIGIAVQCQGMQYELTALGLCDRGSDVYLAAEFIRSAGFALADALHLGCIQRVHIASASPQPSHPAHILAKSLGRRRAARI